MNTKKSRIYGIAGSALLALAVFLGVVKYNKEEVKLQTAQVSKEEVVLIGNETATSEKKKVYKVSLELNPSFPDSLKNQPSN